ncbi:MAG: energy transducer TonB [Flavobacteriales bacterium]
MPQKYALHALCAALLALLPMLLTAQVFVQPEPYGGNQGVKDFLEAEMRFPEAALAEEAKGTSVLIFTVKRDGTLQDLRIWQSFRPDCDAEALRLGALVRWHPGTLGGIPADAEHYLRVPFNAKKYAKARERDPGCPRITAPDLASGTALFDVNKLDTTAVPEVPGGMMGLPAYFQREMRYPEDARRNDIQGPLKLEFVVEASGVVSNAVALKDLGGGCTEEAIRMVRAICWKPGIKDGRRVRTVVPVEILFRLP